MALPIKFAKPLNRKEAERFHDEIYSMAKERYERDVKERKNIKRVMRDLIESILKGRELIIKR